MSTVRLKLALRSITPTKTKWRFAKILNSAIVRPRSWLGLKTVVDVTRRGCNWRLDLNEGLELAIYLGLYQAIPARLLQQYVRPGSLAIDVGANIGAHCIPMARQVGAKGQVIAIEPTNWAFSRLEANVARNPDLRERLILVQAALTDGDSLTKTDTKFFARWPLQGSSANRHPKHLGVLEAADGARFVTLDSLLEEYRTAGRINRPVSFVKLDVDGHEVQVLRGSQRVFAQDRPVMLIEIAPYVQDELPKRLEILLDLLKSMDYQLEHISTGIELPMLARELRLMIPLGAGVDVVARPLGAQ